MAGRTSIIIQGTAWGVQETKNGKRFLRVSVSPGYRDRNGNWVSQPEQNYSVWPAGYGAQGGYGQQPQGGYQPSQPPASDPWGNGGGDPEF